MSDPTTERLDEVTDWIIQPALADSADDQTAIRHLSSDEWRCEQKVDGVRLLVHVHQGKVVGINRKGVITLMPPEVANAFVWFDGEWVFDGELVKNTYWVFDMPRALDLVTPSVPYGDRRSLLEQVWDGFEMPACVSLLPSLQDSVSKIKATSALREAGGEGVMLKRTAAPYSPGRRTKDVLKYKFVKDVDCIVMQLGLEGKQNFSVGLVDEETGEIIEVATVSALTGDGPRVEIGNVVTVRYLYASDDRRLVQPTLPRLRDDKSPGECVMGQLKFTTKEVAG